MYSEEHVALKQYIINTHGQRAFIGDVINCVCVEEKDAPVCGVIEDIRHNNPEGGKLAGVQFVGDNRKYQPLYNIIDFDIINSAGSEEINKPAYSASDFERAASIIHREIISNKSDNRHLEFITDVSLARYNFKRHNIDRTSIASGISRGGLIIIMESGTLPDITIGGDEVLFIEYNFKGEKKSINICNKTSNVSAEWFGFNYNEEIVKRSILDGTDYCMNYNDDRLRAENNGAELTQHEYFERFDKANKINPLDRFKEAVNKMG